MSIATDVLAGAARTASSIITASAPAVTTSLLTAVAERVSRRPDLLRERLAVARSCPVLLEKLSQRACWHNNGFAKIKIAETKRLCLRLHIWPTGRPRSGDVNPHGHRWDFASWIAIGRGLVERYFERVEDTEPGARPYLRCAYGPGYPGLQAQEYAWLRESPTWTWRAGDIYPCSRNVVHTVAPIGDGLITTLVVQGPVRADTAPVFLAPGCPIDQRPEPISTRELSDLLGAVVAGWPREHGSGVVGATAVGGMSG